MSGDTDRVGVGRPHGEGQPYCQWTEALEHRVTDMFGHVWWAIVYGQIKPLRDASLIT